MSASRQLTDVMVRNEISALRCVHGIIEADGIQSRDQFFDMMSAVFVRGGLELRSLADALGFSFSTVFRWQDRRSAPHPSLWPRIVEWVLEALAARVREREQELACSKSVHLV